MKRFLSLVLSLVMVMSLVTISAGAKDFTDDEKITYDEAVAVISEIGVVSGDKDGSFRPTDSLTRQAAAKIICNMILGPTTAVELHADTAPYRDVPANYEFAGYIAYCQKQGIISGYNDGTFRPTAPLTGYAFMKMLLGALGYDAKVEQYEGPNWSINVAKRALGIGLAEGQTSEFSGIKPVTREEAALYAFNTLQADLVKYGTRLTTNVNGTEVTLASGEAESRTWESQQTRVNNIREDNIVQFAEEYFRKLEKERGRDDFERPGYTWLYDREEIGTYVDWSLQVGENYTKGVSGRDLYDLLDATNLKENDLTYYANGLVPGADNPTANDPASFANGGDNIIVRDDVNRANQKDVGITGNGVLTQVFLDKDHKEITVTSISTFLVKATGDYNEKREDAPFDVYTKYGDYTTGHSFTKNVDIDDCAAVADVKEDDWFLAKITYKNNPGCNGTSDGNVVELVEPEILDESTVTKFSASKTGLGNGNVTKVTVGGTEYKNNENAYYDTDVLDEYDATLLTDAKYNVYLDEYGFFIGVDLFEGTKNYVFITGFDRPTSNLSIKTADAAAIFLDGTMQNIKVNVSATNDNIEDINTRYGGSDPGKHGEYFLKWDADLAVTAQDDGMYALNRWFTYTTNKDGVYTLKPATRMVVRQYGVETTIKTDNLFVDDNVLVAADRPYQDLGASGLYSVPAPYGASVTTRERVYGNDDSVFLTVDTDEVDTSNGSALAITEVTGVYTGVQSSEIEIDVASPLEEAQVYIVYNSDNYIIGAVIDGEGDGGTGVVAYVTSGPKSERIEDGVYYWEFEAVMNGTVQTLTVKDSSRKYLNTLRNEADASHEAIGDWVAGRPGATDPTPTTAAELAVSTNTNWNKRDGLVELRFDADNYVTSIRTIEEKDIYSYFGDKRQAEGTDGFGGANSISQGAADDYTPASYDHTRSIDTSDAKVYRVNGINGYMVGVGKTWEHYGDAPGTLFHYDSAPSQLKLVGRTLYTTTDQHDEGLALASDAKAVLIQWENGDWETTEYSSVKSAVNSVALNGDFEGEIVAALNSNGTAAWVVITNYNEVRRGSQTPQGRLSGIDARTFTSPLSGWDGNPYNFSTTGVITYALKTPVANTNYTIVLEQLNENGQWAEIDRWTARIGDTYDQGTLVGDPAWNVWESPFVGNYTSNRTYRLGCDGFYSMVALLP